MKYREVLMHTIGRAADKVQIQIGGVTGTPAGDLAFIVGCLDFTINFLGLILPIADILESLRTIWRTL